MQPVQPPQLRLLSRGSTLLLCPVPCALQDPPRPSHNTPPPPPPHYAPTTPHPTPTGPLRRQDAVPPGAVQAGGHRPRAADPRARPPGGPAHRHAAGQGQGGRGEAGGWVGGGCEDAWGARQGGAAGAGGGGAAQAPRDLPATHPPTHLTHTRFATLSPCLALRRRWTATTTCCAPACARWTRWPRCPQPRRSPPSSNSWTRWCRGPCSRWVRRCLASRCCNGRRRVAAGWPALLAGQRAAAVCRHAPPAALPTH